MRGRLGHVLAVAILAALVTAVFRDVVLGRHTLFYYDILLQNYPFRHFFADALRDGRIPLWCGSIYGGFPLFAEGQASPLYPVQMALFLLLDDVTAFNVSVLLHLVMAGTFTYLLLRAWGSRWEASLFGGAAYALSGVLLARLLHTNMVYGAAYLPALPLCVERFRATGRPRHLAAAGGVLALMLLSSHPFVTTAAVLFTAAHYGLALGTRDRTGLRPVGNRVWVLAGLPVIVGIGVGIAAAQVLPTAELIAASSRGAPPEEFRSVGSLPPLHLLTAIVPDLFGTPATGSYRGGLGSEFYREWCGYVGLSTLALALLGALWRPDRTRGMLAGTALLGTLTSLGSHSVVHGALHSLPLLSAQRIPGRYLILVGFATCALAGLGLDRLMSARGRVAPRVLAGPAVFAAAVAATVVLALSVNAAAFAPGADVSPAGSAAALELLGSLTRAALLGAAVTGVVTARLLGRLPPRPAAAALLVLLVVDLAPFGRAANPTADRSVLLTPPHTAAVMAGEPGPWRMLRTTEENWVGPAAADRVDPFTPAWRGHESRYAEATAPLIANSAMLWDVDSLEGFGPLAPRRYLALMGQPGFLGSRPALHPTRAMLDLCNVRFVVTDRPLEHRDLRLVDVDDDLGLAVYRNEAALGGAWLVSHWSVAASEQRAIELVRDAAFRPHRTAVLEDTPLDWRADPPPVGAHGEPAGAARIERWEDGAIDVVTDTGDWALLVISDAHDPGWRATVDDRPAEVLRADVLLKGVVVPPGRHLVRLRYRPPSAAGGRLISVAFLVLCPLVGAALRRWRPAVLATRPSSRRAPPLGRAGAAILLALAGVVLGTLLVACVRDSSALLL